MASSQSRKKVVLQKYHIELLSTLSDCIEDVLPDLESAGAISIDQRDQVREYVEAKMPVNAVDYLLNDHIKRPLSVEINNNFMKLLEVMKKAPKCSPQCKALAATVENDLKIEMSSEMDEITKGMESLGGKTTPTKKTGLKPYFYPKMLYHINEYGGSFWSKPCPLTRPLFLAKGPNDEIYVRDDEKNRLVMFKNNGGKLEYSTYFAGEGNGQGYFKNITGIAASKDYLYVADCYLDYIQKLHIKNGGYVGQIGSHGSKDGEFNSPHGLALDEDNSLLYVCDTDNNRIQVFKNDTFSENFRRINGFSFNHPEDIALNKYKGQLFVTDSGNSRVLTFTFNQEAVGVSMIAKNLLYWPHGVCYKDSIVVFSCCTNSVYMFDDEGYSHEYPGPFDNPWGVVMLDDKQLVVANHDSNKLTVIVLL